MRLLSFFVAMAFALMPLSAPAETTRTLSGEIMVLERMALPDETLVIVDLTALDETRISESRVRTQGAQSPFPFEITAPADQDVILRVGLRGMADGVWLSEPVLVRASAEDTGLGTLRAARVPLMGFASLMSCGNTLVEVGMLPDSVRVRINEQLLSLQAQPAASGALYVDPNNANTSLHMRGNAAILRVDGAELAECSLLPPQTDLTEGVWNVSALGERPTLFPSRTELAFFPDGRLSATVGCNRIIGNFQRHGGFLAFGRMASTMMACPDDLAAQERNFIAALADVDSYRLDPENGRLTLLAAGAPVIQARK